MTVALPNRLPLARVVTLPRLLAVGALVAVTLPTACWYYFWTVVQPTITASGGLYFFCPIILSVPAFSQDDARWSTDPLGPSQDTLGSAGCAVTSAAMTLQSYGIDTDPQRLNKFLMTNSGYTPEGWIYWEKAADLANGHLEKAYEDAPSYALLDRNLLAGNPVIVRLRLDNGTNHFVVVVGKSGWDYLIRDPAAISLGIYPLSRRSNEVTGLRFYRRLP